MKRGCRSLPVDKFIVFLSLRNDGLLSVITAANMNPVIWRIVDKVVKLDSNILVKGIPHCMIFRVLNIK